MFLEVELKKMDAHSSVMKVKGILDISTIDLFNRYLYDIEQLKDSILVDLTEMEFIDSTGIGSLMEVIRLSQEEGFEVDFTGINQAVKDILETVGFFTILEAIKERDSSVS